MKALMFSLVFIAHPCSALEEEQRAVSIIFNGQVENVGVVDPGDDSEQNFRIVMSPIAASGYCKRATITMPKDSPEKGGSTFARALVGDGLVFEYAIALDQSDCVSKNERLIFFRVPWLTGPDRPVTRFLALLSALRRGGDIAAKDWSLETDEPERLSCLRENRDLGILSFWRDIFGAEDGQTQYVAIFSGCDDALGRPMAAYISYDERTLAYKVELSFHMGTGVGIR